MRCPALTRSRGWPAVPVLTLVTLSLAACGSDEPDWHSLDPLGFGDDQLVFEWVPGSIDAGPASLRVRLLSRGGDSIIYEGSLANAGADIGYGNLLPQVDTVIEAQRICTQ